ncbi:MAG: phage terminase large subunit [Nitrospinaceae bacterium]
MHQALYATCQGLILDAERTGRGARHAEAAPRGHAKSTLTSLILPLWCIVGRRRKFIGLVSDTTPQAEEFLEFLKAELEVNERLQEDFPEACGRGRPWRLGQIVTRNGVRLKCWGKRKAIRGARHRNRRLDLILCDDMEGDHSVASPRQREKDRAWFFKALMKAGGRYTVVIVVGTILHNESLLAGVLKRPGWTGRKWQAVVRWSASPLWDRWETLFAARDEAAADRFYRAHETEMLRGVRVLWPEVEDYLFLMKMRVSDGPAFFDSEKQNDPLPPGAALFNENWFVFAAEAEVERHLAEGRYGSILAAVDPSMGKTSRRNDPSAIIIAGRREDGVFDILEADIEHRHPDKLMEDLFAWHQKYGLTLAGIEEVQFQELFKDLVVRESARRGLYLAVEGLRPHTDKHLRIMRLQPHIKNGVFRFRQRQTRLLDQLRQYPRADHDDGPDALEMLLTLTQRSLGGPRIRSLVEPKSIT